MPAPVNSDVIFTFRETMLFPNGKEVRLGDRVKFSNGELGAVVFSIDTDEYSTAFPKADWEYLRNGVMVRTEAGALIHYEDPNTCVIFPADDAEEI